MAGLCFWLLVVPGGGAVFAGTVPESGRFTPASTRDARAPRRVLVLYPDQRLLPTNILFDVSFRETLGSDAGPPIDCFSEFLDEVRFPAHDQERMSDFLRAKYGERPPEVIVAFTPPSLDLCLRYRSHLFPDVPIVFAVMGDEILGGPDLGRRVTGVRASFDAAATLRLALRLHPRTRQVYLVGGAAGSDSTRVALGQSIFRTSEFHVTFHSLESQPLPQLLEKLSRLPENSLVIDLSILGSSPESTAGSRQEMAERVARASCAPIYAAYDPLVGYGVVGAVTTPLQAIGRETALLVLQVLSCQDPDQLPPVRTLAATPIFDWRQLRRWGIRERRLPAGRIVQFETPSLWQQHSRLMITATGLLLVQSGLIFALVLQSRRRRRAEREAQGRRQELAHMTRVATMGELTASLAHEINQPLAAILSNAQAAQRLLASGRMNGQEIREILADIVADDQRAGEVIRRMRAVLRRGESNPTILDVNDLVAEAIGLVRGEMILQNVALSLDLSSEPCWVHGDRIQLQQVLLNLMMNALDAMKDTTDGGRRVIVRTAATNGRDVKVSVEDSGTGVQAEKLEQIFEPFVTTKPHGLGLGLSICRSIIQAHGGRIGTTNGVDRGATFWFTLPAAEELRT